MSSEVAAATITGNRTAPPRTPFAPVLNFALVDGFGQLVSDSEYGTGICCEVPSSFSSGTTEIATTFGKTRVCSEQGRVPFSSYSLVDVEAGTSFMIVASCSWTRTAITG